MNDDSMNNNMQRTLYLRQKGVKNNAFQLSLAFPDTMRNDLRHIPNDLARSALFTTRNKKEARRTLQRAALFSLAEKVKIVFTGIELRADDDELVWLQIINYGQKLPFGEPYEFSISQLVKDLGWPKNGTYYEKARKCISRLKANEIIIQNERAYGKSGAWSLIRSYETENDDKENNPVKYRVWIDPEMIVLFAGETFTSHKWLAYRKLSPVARRLADYINSHRHPYSLSIERFAQMCDADYKDKYRWRQRVKHACQEVQNAEIAQMVILIDDQIECAH